MSMLDAVAWSNSPLQLVSQARLVDILDHQLANLREDRLEASGVHVEDNQAYVVFDNQRFVAEIGLPMQAEPPRGRIIHVDFHDDRVDGYEDITRDVRGQRWLLLVEALERSRRYTPLVVEAEADWTGAHSWPLDFEVPSSNKGFEGVACIPHDGGTTLLGLCEVLRHNLQCRHHGTFPADHPSARRAGTPLVRQSLYELISSIDGQAVRAGSRVTSC
jgi:hypothetical protein